MDHTPRIIRSMAFVPAHDPDIVLAAADAGLDAVGLDLEDSTPPQYKQQARELFRSLARELTDRGVLVMARTNGFDAGCEADIEAVVCEDLHCCNFPKAESADQITRVADLLGRAEKAEGIDEGRILLRPVVETAQGVRGAYEVASASPRVAYMGGVAGTQWGDLGASVGVIESVSGTESHYLRSKVLMDVRAAGVPFPIGGGATARVTREGTRAFALENKHLGYTGSYCQQRPEIVEVIHEVFTPTRAEAQDYAEVVGLLEQAVAEGATAVHSAGRHIDATVLEGLRAKVALARRVGVL